MLLALETTGVLAGILIAFELQEWGSQRDQAAKHNQLMQRLFEETESDVAALRNMRDVLRSIVEREQTFAVTLAKGECPNVRDFDAVGTTMMMPALTAPSSVYQELMGAGGLSSIERKDVRDSLALYRYELEWGQKQADYFRADRQDPVPESDPRTRIIFDPHADEPQVSSYDTKALCSDQVFKNRMAVATRQHTTFLVYFDNPFKDAIDVCVRLGDSLGKACVPTFGGPLKGDDQAYAKTTVAKMRRGLAKPS